MVSVSVTVEERVKKEAICLPSTSKRWPRALMVVQGKEPLDVVVVGFEEEEVEEAEEEEEEEE
jgi:hypothetical protein